MRKLQKMLTAGIPNIYFTVGQSREKLGRPRVVTTAASPEAPAAVSKSSSVATSDVVFSSIPRAYCLKRSGQRLPVDPSLRQPLGMTILRRPLCSIALWPHAEGHHCNDKRKAISKWAFRHLRMDDRGDTKIQRSTMCDPEQ